MATYGREVVYPAVDSFDHQSFARAVNANDWPYDPFNSSWGVGVDVLLQANWSASTWLSYRLWSATRCTGRFPLPLLGFDFFPNSFVVCPLCHNNEVDLAHIMGVCANTQALRRKHCVPNVSWDRLRSWLFDASHIVDDGGSLTDQVTFVASSMTLVGEAVSLNSAAVDGLLGQATSSTS